MICFLSLSLINSLPFYLFRTFIFLTFPRIPVPSVLFDQAVVITSSDLCHVKTRVTLRLYPSAWGCHGDDM